MRTGTILCAIAALALCAGMVAADPFNVEERPWTYPDGKFDGRDEYPEIEPNDTCPGTQVIACGDIITPAALDFGGDLDHFPFTLTGPTAVTLGTDDVDPGAPDGTDTYIELWSGDCLTYLAGDDDGGPGLYSLLNINLAAGDYVAMVRGYNSTSVGPYKLFFDCIGVEPPPENNDCGGAEEFQYFIERCTAGLIEGSTQFAMDTYNPAIPGPSCTGWSAAGTDVVYYMDLEAGDQVSMTYTQLEWDASFYIVTDCGNMNSCVAGADDNYNTGGPEVLAYTATTAGRYYVILDAYSAASGGPFTLNYTITCPEPTPTSKTTWGQIKSTY
ncbi:MAG: PPC domain-containing protein [Candidatus Eisenbacteria bacterium]|uniref:PPC domain-containing protein n=1 Tax=Eiseniibacteriota bacterium TaxID=2212470 RepID=A0A948RYZ8_UNCEI|nr:PPC domain-containing protein [Candidatus Eisenbacteria bacterium]MBU1950641.1 PPC domain-containing protein [Candidatus Eisenbacteria bacterium]MBU2691737.1 PPC domain-containing protein [Candidatus Eisenbacteria bacterium]